MKKELQVSGMSCHGCEMLIKEALEELDGVNEAEVSHIEGIVSLDYDPARVNMETITSTIEEQGFKVKA
ncbi:MAG: cation transporter [Chlorobiales bacterium]|nr:cation transporter [Chlorobiales bacterium]